MGLSTSLEVLRGHCCVSKQERSLVVLRESQTVLGPELESVKSQVPHSLYNLSVPVSLP